MRNIKNAEKAGMLSFHFSNSKDLKDKLEYVKIKKIKGKEGEYDDYEYEVEMRLKCTKCDFCESHWETRHEKRNHEGGGYAGEVRKTWE